MRLMPPEDFPFDQVPGGRNYQVGGMDIRGNDFYYYKDWDYSGGRRRLMCPEALFRTLKTELPAPDCENLVV